MSLKVTNQDMIFSAFAVYLIASGYVECRYHLKGCLSYQKPVLNSHNEILYCADQCPYGCIESYSPPWGTYCQLLPIGCKDRLCIFCEVGYTRVYWYYNKYRCLADVNPTSPLINKKSTSTPKTVIEEISEDCKFELTLFSKKICVDECPVGYHKEGGKCTACADRNCQSCESSSAVCEKCLPQYAILRDENGNFQECVRNCPKGYQLTLEKSCEKVIPPPCPVENCESCASAIGRRGTCVECQSNYVLFRDSFEVVCQRNCPHGYYVANMPTGNGKVCAKCKIKFCKTCSAADSCSLCMEPLILDKKTGLCVTCPKFKEYNYLSKGCTQIRTYTIFRLKTNFISIPLVH